MNKGKLIYFKSNTNDLYRGLEEQIQEGHIVL